MNITATIPMADGFGMHGGGWWVLGIAGMLLCMGAMMWMMMRGMGGSSQRSSSPSESPGTKNSALEILERRFAEGSISVEDYRARREVLVEGTSDPDGDGGGEPLTTAGGGERRQS